MELRLFQVKATNHDTVFLSGSPTGRLLDWEHRSCTGKSTASSVQFWPWKALKRKFKIFLWTFKKGLVSVKIRIKSFRTALTVINPYTYRFALSSFKPSRWRNQSTTVRLNSPNSQVNRIPSIFTSPINRSPVDVWTWSWMAAYNCLFEGKV